VQTVLRREANTVGGESMASGREEQQQFFYEQQSLKVGVEGEREQQGRQEVWSSGQLYSTGQCVQEEQPEVWLGARRACREEATSSAESRARRRQDRVGGALETSGAPMGDKGQLLVAFNGGEHCPSHNKPHTLISDCQQQTRETPSGRDTLEQSFEHDLLAGHTHNCFIPKATNRPESSHHQRPTSSIINGHLAGVHNSRSYHLEEQQQQQQQANNQVHFEHCPFSQQDQIETSHFVQLVS